ncbi:hypothetical protein SISNIDRAFT_482087 [Sistotremastrum niveocremeum HHB9708]|uniref:Fungal lipase-type domain-containing protein n=1 Tax=Sistotremastrum niveocremeum HHB9708 TaxID=1314777 RepID=A0A164YQW9_9AGAM|nr:hypothetical protein SISNIDRAFT_482087 [Sistotremastrum niveocremeum HHB9708]
MAQWDIHQQVFATSLCSNALLDTKAPLSKLQSSIEQLVPNYISEFKDKGMAGWEVVWGPTVWKHKLEWWESDKKTGPDNTWFIGHHPAAQFHDGTFDTYVVSIAGTASTYAWLKEDFVVRPVVDFNEFAANIKQVPVAATDIDDNTKTYIALGDAQAVYTLLNTTAPPSARSPGTTIVDFLQNLPSTLETAPRIVFTGHSLGGALTPMTALILQLQQAKPLKNVLTFPTAGPTPGNKNFANLFGKFNPLQFLGPAPYQAWNSNLRNVYDAIPQAWSTDQTDYPGQNIKHILKLYGDIPRAVYAVVWVPIQFALGLVDASKITYIPIPGKTFSAPQPPVPQKFSQFLGTVRNQHVAAYEDFLGVIPPSISAVIKRSCLLWPTVGKKTLEEWAEGLPVFEQRGLQRSLDNEVAKDTQVQALVSTR